MLEYFRLNMADVRPFSLTDEETSAIQYLAETKYKTWEWNWGYGPPYTFSNRLEVNKKPHQCRLLVKDGIIWGCDIEGSVEMAAAGKKLIGCRHMYPDLLRTFRSENIPISEEEVYKFF
jgi:lipoate-protein ligase A